MLPRRRCTWHQAEGRVALSGVRGRASIPTPRQAISTMRVATRGSGRPGMPGRRPIWSPARRPKRWPDCRPGSPTARSGCRSGPARGDRRSPGRDDRGSGQGPRGAGSANRYRRGRGGNRRLGCADRQTGTGPRPVARSLRGMPQRSDTGHDRACCQAGGSAGGPEKHRGTRCRPDDDIAVAGGSASRPRPAADQALRTARETALGAAKDRESADKALAACRERHRNAKQTFHTPPSRARPWRGSLPGSQAGHRDAGVGPGGRRGVLARAQERRGRGEDGSVRRLAGTARPDLEALRQAHAAMLEALGRATEERVGGEKTVSSI